VHFASCDKKSFAVSKGMIDEIKTSELAEVLGISQPYASQIKGGTRAMTTRLALILFKKRGIKVGPLSGVATRDINALARFEGLEI
jgi:hypothetical protein